MDWVGGTVEKIDGWLIRINEKVENGAVIEGAEGDMSDNLAHCHSQ